MDPDLKQRLVGAVVITSLAAIFVPMLFDDPIDETGKQIHQLQIPKSPVQFSTEGSRKLPSSVDDVINLPAPEPLKQERVRKQSVSEMERWFIQVGIFGQENNAIALQNKIRKQGFPVTISKVSGEKDVLYRVRVGPELDKKRAEMMKQKIDQLNGIKGILTSVDE